MILSTLKSHKNPLLRVDTPTSRRAPSALSSLAAAAIASKSPAPASSSSSTSSPAVSSASSSAVLHNPQQLYANLRIVPITPQC